MQRTFQQYCREVAARFGGTMLPSAGREVIVCFGYPAAHEDAALRGVRTGVALLQDLPRLNEQLSAQTGVRLAIWVGIHTGQAVAGAGDASRNEGISIVGDGFGIGSSMLGLLKVATAARAAI